jgi:hypothetical protein
MVLSHRYSDKRKKTFYERGAGTFELPDLLRSKAKVPLTTKDAPAEVRLGISILSPIYRDLRRRVTIAISRRMRHVAAL